MHFWQLAISSLPELAIVKWTFSWFWRVVWFSLDANSVIYLLFVAKKYLLVFFVTCISLLFSILVCSVFGLWINSKLLWRERALRERKKERSRRLFLYTSVTVTNFQYPQLTSHGNQVNTTSTLRQGQNRKRNWETSTHNCYNCHYGEPQC